MLRIFIGTDSKSGCAECQMVLEYSIKKHASGPVDIVWMKHSSDPNSLWCGWNSTKWSTPFSGMRYAIPEYCEFRGNALYQDDDQLWLCDPYEILEHKISGNNVMTGKRLSNGEIRHCVSLIDNSKFKNWELNPSRKYTFNPDIGLQNVREHPDYNEFCKAQTFPLTEIIGDEWNCYDGEDMDIRDIKVLHFTNMSTNPGVKMAIKRLGSQALHWFDGELLEHRRKDIEDVFLKYYGEAIDAGYKVTDYISDEQVDYIKQSQKDYRANNGWD